MDSQGSADGAGFDGGDDDGPEEFDAQGFDGQEPADDHADNGPDMPDAPISGGNNDEQ